MKKFMILTSLLFSQITMASLQIGDTVIALQNEEDYYVPTQELVVDVTDFNEETGQYRTSDNVWRFEEDMDKVKMLEEPKIVLSFQGKKAFNVHKNKNVKVNTVFQPSNEVYSVKVIAERYDQYKDGLVNSYVALDPKTNEKFVLRAAYTLEKISLEEMSIKEGKSFIQILQEYYGENSVVHLKNAQAIYKRNPLNWYYHSGFRTGCPYVIKAASESYQNVNGLRLATEKIRLQCMRTTEPKLGSSHRASGIYNQVEQIVNKGQSYQAGDCVRIPSSDNHHNFFNRYNPATILRVYENNLVITDKSEKVFSLSGLKDCR